MKKTVVILLLNISISIMAFSISLYGNFIPIYAERFGASYLDLGIIGVVFSIPYVVLPALVGILSDKVDKRPLYLMGLLGCTVTPFLFLYTSSVLDIVLIRAFNGVAYTFLWPTIEAFLVDLTTIEKRTKTMARYSFAWAFGFLLGPLAGSLVMAATGDNYALLFLTGFGVATLSLIVAGYALTRHRKSEGTKVSVEDMRSQPFSVTAFLPILLCVMIYSTALGLLTSIFPAYADSLDISVSVIGILFGVFGAVRLATFLTVNRIVRIGIKRSFILALLLQTVGLMSVAIFRNFLGLMLLNVLFGFAMGILSPLTLALASKIAPRGRIGLAIGLLEAIFGVGMTVGPFIGGLAAQLISPETPFIIIAVFTLMAAIPIYAWKKIDKGSLTY